MKRIFSLMFIMFIGLFALTGCGSKGTEVVFWNPFAGADGETFQVLVDGFNEEYKGEYYINSQTTANDGNAYYDKIKTSAQSGDGPDIAIMHIDQLPQYQKNDIIHAWTSDELAAMNIEASEFSQTTIDSATFDNQLYAVPLDTHPLVLWVNTDLLPVDEIPTNLEEVKALTEKGTEGSYTMAVPSNPYVLNRFLYTVFLQNDIDIVDESGTKVLYNTPKAASILQIMQDVSAADYTPAPGEDVSNMFKLGEVSTLFEGIWMKNAWDEAGLNTVAVPLTGLFGDTPANWASSHTFVKMNDEMTPEQTDAATSFIGYVEANAVEWAKAGQIPANEAARESDEFKSMEPQNTLAENMNDYKFYPSVETQDATWNAFESYANEVYLGQKTPQEALDAAQKDGEGAAAELVK